MSARCIAPGCRCARAKCSTCNGCHVRTAAAPARRRWSHGRKGLFNSVYAGATATGAAFPGTVNTISPDAGDTMARARYARGSSCIDPATMIERCGLQSITPSANVVYDEIWKPAALPDRLVRLQPISSSRPRSPANVDCFPVWTPTCRITIHYATIGTRPGQIHPLWSVPRPAAGVDTNGTGMLDLSADLHVLPSPREPDGRGDAAAAGRVARAHR